MIAVGKIRYDNAYNKIYPKIDNFELIEVMTKCTTYGSLGPYVLKNDQNQIFENIWQGSKIYPKVYKISRPWSKFVPESTWKRDNEIHYKDGKVLSRYWKWRMDVKNFQYPIRYPNGNHSKEAIGCIISDEICENPKMLDYISARKQLYFPLYIDLVKKQPLYNKLIRKLNNNENLLIAEVDVAWQDDLKYYIEKYGIEDKNFINDYTMIANKEYIKIMLNDVKNPCGHGIALAMSLINDVYGDDIMKLLDSSVGNV